MKEVEGSEHSGAVVKTKSSSGCLIVEKKAERKSLNLNKERKRPRVVVTDSDSDSDSESSDDELAEPRKVYKFSTGLVEKQSPHVNVSDHRHRLMLDKRKSEKKDFYSENKTIRNAIADDLTLSVSNEDDKHDFDDSQVKTGVLKSKSIGVSSSGNSTMKVVKRKGTINAKIKNVTTSLKAKESKIKRASCTEKQLLRDKIKKMLFRAGWKIDYRKRRNRDYLDSVYISPTGTGYWSITKAYEALRKEEKDKSKDSGDFTPLPNEILNKLTRQTRKKIEREIQKSKNHQGNGNKSKWDRVKKSAQHVASHQQIASFMRVRDSRKLTESRLVEASVESDDNSGKKTPRKDLLKKPTVRTSSHVVHNKNGTIGRLTLMGRGSDKVQNSEENGVAFYSGKRTLLSWLIDCGVVSVGEKVEYMNLRKTRVMQQGWITEDGIHCDCCSKIVTIVRFELHAGSKLGRPFQNIFIQSGKSLMQCQIDAWNKQQESERKGFHGVDVDGDDPNDDTCGLCGDGGDLICCDGCPSTFHLSCLDMQMLPQGDWHCPNCACKYCEIVGGYCTKASGRTESSLLTCHLCEKKYHKSCSPEMDDEPMPIDTKDLNFPFCGQNCRQLYSRLQKLLWIKHELNSGFSWSLIHRSDPLPDVSSVNYSQIVECNSKLAVALLVMDECFLPIVDTRSGINLIHNVVYNCGSNFSRLNYSGFFTAILERGDEMICAASIRIHGTQVAEMPFIGTRHLYRRQGMCRLLLQAIESSLASLEVEKLVIPAIEEHMNTWTSAFGFSPLEKSHKQEMRSFNMLVFPGTDMLQKSLIKQDTQEGNITSEKGKKGVEVDDSSNPLAKKSELNGDYSTELEIHITEKKSDPQSNTNALKGTVQDVSKTTEGSVADSASNVQATNANSLPPQALDGASQDTVSTQVPCGPQLPVATKVSVSVNTHSDSIPLEPDLVFPGKESGCLDAHSMSMAKENDATNRNRNA